MSQVLNFGIPAPIDIQVEGYNLVKGAEVAKRLQEAVRMVPGAVDVRLKQTLNAPAYQVDVDRYRAARLGLSQADVANGLLVSLSGNGQLAPSFFLDPNNGVNYTVQVKAPLEEIRFPRTADGHSLQPERRLPPVPGAGVHSGDGRHHGPFGAPVQLRLPAPRGGAQ